ncbi:MAG: 3-deoxy-8-phosphooctulonate synthase [Deltaproteobacteria bacterium]|jgi:2-dehydro-3-deoxyphosphooctonate aldolase (KDO 8-P synthase)|nr:3-deoxy-8-phosphooctulonate synthase [Deltaproteobacteria bacterium]
MSQKIAIGSVPLGGDAPLLLVAGPCVIESLSLSLETARALKAIASKLGVGLVFKSSFDKANRSSLESFRGPGLDKGLQILADVKSAVGVPVVSDIHEAWQAPVAAQVLDFIQIPAFLARQTDLLVAASDSGRPVNVKKAQFMAPGDMERAVLKMASRPNFRGLSLCERGTTFGYRNLVVDMRSLVIMRSFGWPVIFDATHSVQLPAAAGDKSSGERQFIPALARAAVAVGVDGLFVETHPSPENALCDSANQWPLDRLESLLTSLIAIRASLGAEAYAP